MCNPNCRHDKGFMLVYSSIEEVYKWKCGYSCGLSFPWSPDFAGKQGEDWRERTVLYIKQVGQKPGPRLSEEGLKL